MNMLVPRQATINFRIFFNGAGSKIKFDIFNVNMTY